MPLQNMISWLRDVENLACTAYSAAAGAEELPKELREFLERLAEDESLHYHLMGSAAELIRRQEKSPASAIMIDDQTDTRITRPLHELREKIDAGHLTEADILNAIVTSESSEWNDIFLYVINICAGLSAEFQYMTAAIQAHEKRIEDYLNSRDISLAGKIKALPEIWKNSLLVVEDESSVRNLFERIVSKFGRVTTAQNGDIALRKIEQQFFNVIISDINMPVMDGISMLKRVMEEQPRMGSHFIMCTGNFSPDIERMVQEYGVRLLQKPVTIRALRESVQQILAASL